MILVDKLACSNALITVHPLEKIIFAGLVMVLGLIFDSLVVHALSIITVMVLLVAKARISISYYFKIMSVPLAFLLIGTLTIVMRIESRSDELLLFSPLLSNYIGVSSEGLSFSVRLFLKSMSIVSGLYFLALTTYMSSLLGILKKIRVSSIFIELAGLVYRFIFIVLQQASTIQIAQEARLGHCGIKRRIKATGSLLSNLLLKTLKKADTVEHALQARCYMGEINVLEREYRLSKKNYCMIAVYGICIVALGLLSSGG